MQGSDLVEKIDSHNILIRSIFSLSKTRQSNLILLPMDRTDGVKQNVKADPVPNDVIY